MSNSPWQLDDACQTAQLKLDSLTGDIGLGFPQRGWQSLAIGGQPLGVSPCQLILPDTNDTAITPASIHIRGNDLVANYASSGSRQFAVQVYRSASNIDRDQSGWLLKTLVSLNTQRLDGLPSLTIQTDYSDAELTTDSQPEAILLRPEGVDYSYAEIVDPIDFQSCEFASNGWQRRFEEPLEKGVIRRIRLWSAVVPREGDLDSVESLRTGFRAAAPPLTA